MKKVAIIGYGYVGKAMHKIFPDACIYDTNEAAAPVMCSKDVVNDYDLAIICVPTPMKEDGSCDISYVEDVMSWLKTPLILLKSTVPPLTTENLASRFDKKICFSPEYVGEGKYWVPPWKYPDPTDPRSHGFLIIGGEDVTASAIVNVFLERLGPDTEYCITDAKTAELCKYMENSWGAHKVMFCNEWYNIAAAFGVDYNKLRELWLKDSRVERMHTAVFPDSPGFGGKCFPKDIHAIVKASEKVGYEPKLLKQVIKNNEDLHKE